MALTLSCFHLTSAALACVHTACNRCTRRCLVFRQRLSYIYNFCSVRLYPPFCSLKRETSEIQDRDLHPPLTLYLHRLYGEYFYGKMNANNARRWWRALNGRIANDRSSFMCYSFLWVDNLFKYLSSYRLCGLPLQIKVLSK